MLTLSKSRFQPVLFWSIAWLGMVFYGRVSAQEVIRGPYLQMGTPTSLIVKWRTDLATNSRVVYGLSPNILNIGVVIPGDTTEHEVRLTNLQPDTKYFYAVGSSTTVLAGGDSSHFFLTGPTTGTKKSTRIWILGDSGTKNSNAEAVRDAYYEYTSDRHTDLWLMLGDNAYGDGTDEQYQAAVFDMYPEMLRKSVLWPTRGNHDRAPRDDFDDWTGGTYYDIFNLPIAGEAGGMPSGTEAYYSFDYGNIHFVCLESTSSDLRDLESPMWTWLAEDLAANTQDWTLAFWHHPPYSKGSHDSDDESSLTQMRERALPILEAWGVDLVLTGHSHSYERSFLLDRHYGMSATLADSMIIDDGNGQIEVDGAYSKTTVGPAPNEGAVYVVAGSSGKLGNGSLDHPVMVTSLRVLGSLVLDIDDKELMATFIDDSVSVRDYFSIFKGGGNFTSFLEKQNGDNQIGLVDSTLAKALVVKVTNSDNQPVSGIAVTFRVISGQGNLSSTEPQLSDAEGLVSISLRLGTSPGIVKVRALADEANATPVTFTATAVLPSTEVLISPAVSTTTTPSDTDDPAIWIHPDDPSRSVIVGTDKQAGIFVWNLAGQLVQQISQGTSVNNVDVRSNVQFGSETVDLVVANLRDAGKLAMFKINRSYADSDVLIQVSDKNSLNNSIQEDSYGLGLYHRKSDGALFVFERPKSSGVVRQYQITGEAVNDGLRVTSVRDLNYAGSTAEGFVADDELGYVYIPEEEKGIYKYFADPLASADTVGFFAADDGIAGDREGTAIYACSDSTGYLVLSSQGNSTIKLYERQGNNRFIGTLVALNDSRETGLGTDGLDATSASVLPDYPHGFLVVHDQSGHRFHIYDWKAAAESHLNLCVPAPPKVSKPVIESDPSSFDFGEVFVDSSAMLSVKVRNTGDAELQITNIEFVGANASEFRIEAGVTQFGVAPGDSHAVEVNFVPVSGGQKNATLQIVNSDLNHNPSEILLVGTGVKKLPVSIQPEPNPAIPDRITLKANYPNPFNAGTTIEYGLPELTPVKLVIFNLVGQPIRKLVDDVQPPGFKRLRWSGQDDAGRDASSGIYYLQLKAGATVLVRKVTLLR
ncbi:phytase [bacterium]|nr:phytase [bacterium]